MVRGGRISQANGDGRGLGAVPTTLKYAVAGFDKIESRVAAGTKSQPGV
jgi:hypothetical protein